MLKEGGRGGVGEREEAWNMKGDVGTEEKARWRRREERWEGKRRKYKRNE